jgi:hypothetical protein
MSFLKEILKIFKKSKTNSKEIENLATDLIEINNSDESMDEIAAVITATLLSVEESNDDEIAAVIATAISSLDVQLDAYEVTAAVTALLLSMEENLKIAV